MQGIIRSLKTSTFQRSLSADKFQIGIKQRLPLNFKHQIVRIHNRTFLQHN